MDDHEKKLRPAKGLANGFALAIGFWALVLGAYLLLR